MRMALVPSAVLHRNFVAARNLVTSLVESSPGGKVIALVGPTQAGKSLIFSHVVDTVRDRIRTDDCSAIPILSLSLATSQDGRISPRHLTLKMLKALRHPMYMHIGELDEQEHYRPSRGFDEGTMRTAVETALQARSTLYVALDEAHHLTHTRDPVVRANVLQSIKCLGAIERTLLLVGGYELAYQGLFDSAHFAGRLVCVELSPYTDTEDDFIEWLRVVKCLSGHIQLRSRTLLVDMAEELLHASNGSIGLLVKILWSAQSVSSGGLIDKRAISASLPSKSEHEQIYKDIVRGKLALARLPKPSYTPAVEESGESTSDIARKSKPFRRKPNRYITQVSVFKE